MECFEYTVTPRRRPPHYHNHFNAVFPMSLPYVSLTRPPASRPWPQSSCYKTVNRILRNTTTIFYRYPFAGKLVTCQQQFALLHHVVLKHRGCRLCRRECKRSECQCDVTNSYCKLFWNLLYRHRLFPLCHFIVYGSK